jgi:hypothetical protein
MWRTLSKTRASPKKKEKPFAVFSWILYFSLDRDKRRRLSLDVKTMFIV